MNPIYNSKLNGGEDESDITIINTSIVNENSTINAPPRPIEEPKNTEKDDFVYIEQDKMESAKNIEKVLQNYQQNLSNENQTDFDCARQIVTRLVDLVRPIYSNDTKKMTDFEQLIEQIEVSHKRRSIESKRKLQELRDQIDHLRNRLIEIEDGPNIKTNGFHSIEIVDNFEGWSEMQDDTKKLHEIIERQNSQIHQILKLIDEAGIDTRSVGLDNKFLNRPEPAAVSHQENPDSNKNGSPEKMTAMRKNLLERFQKEASKSQEDENPETPETPEPAKNGVNPSPGSSPTQSYDSLAIESLNYAFGETKMPFNQPRAQIDETFIDHQRKAEAMDIDPADKQDEIKPPPSPRETSICPICNAEFPTKSKDGSKTIYDHLEICLAPPVPTKPKPTLALICPACEKKFSDDQEEEYRKHLARCFEDDRF